MASSISAASLPESLMLNGASDFLHRCRNMCWHENMNIGNLSHCLLVALSSSLSSFLILSWSRPPEEAVVVVVDDEVVVVVDDDEVVVVVFVDFVAANVVAFFLFNLTKLGVFMHDNFVFYSSCLDSSTS